MRAITDQSPIVRDWVANHIPDCSRGWPNGYAIGVVNDNNELVGGSVYHEFSPESRVIEMSSASITPRWITRSTLKTLFWYPFDYLKCRLVIMRVHPDNHRMRSIATKLGCREYVIDDLRADGVADIVYTLTEAAWRKFIGDTHGQG